MVRQFWFSSFFEFKMASESQNLLKSHNFWMFHVFSWLNQMEWVIWSYGPLILIYENNINSYCGILRWQHLHGKTKQLTFWALSEIEEVQHLPIVVIYGLEHNWTQIWSEFSKMVDPIWRIQYGWVSYRGLHQKLPWIWVKGTLFQCFLGRWIRKCGRSSPIASDFWDNWDLWGKKALFLPSILHLGWEYTFPTFFRLLNTEMWSLLPYHVRLLR